jgi:DNA-binding GntR family transcriptional regulator
MPVIAPSPTAYDLLRSEILLGELMPGERLRVADLNARYKIGLTPIREALLRLTSEGLVDNENNRGAWVRHISIAELRDLFSIRRELEATCLRMAMENRTPEWEAEILRTLHLLSSAPLPQTAHDRDGATRWETFHRQFHFTLVSACGSAWRLRFWNTLTDHSERYRKLRLITASPDSSISRDIKAEHEAIAKAVINGGSDRALALMDSHLTETETVVTQLLAGMENEGGRAV